MRAPGRLVLTSCLLGSIGATIMILGAAQAAVARPTADQCSATATALRAILSQFRDTHRPLRWGSSDDRGRIIVRESLAEPPGPDNRPARWIAWPFDNSPTAIDPPDRKLLERFATADSDHAISCPGVRSIAARGGIRFEVEPRGRPNYRRLYRATSLSLSLAAVSADGLEALVYSGSVSGPLAGGGALWWLRRPLGRPWRVVGTVGLWVS